MAISALLGVRTGWNDEPELRDRGFAYEVNTSRSGEAFTFDNMHCMTFVMLKAHPGQRWRKLFDGDSEGLRELPLGEPPHSVLEDQVEGFKPANHYRVVDGTARCQCEGLRISSSSAKPTDATMLPRFPIADVVPPTSSSKDERRRACGLLLEGAELNTPSI